MLERDVERKFVEGVKRLGGKAYKFVSPGNTGVPDRLIVLPGGRVEFVELKQAGKNPTPIQERQIARLESLGCHVYVVRGIDDVYSYLSRGQP